MFARALLASRVEAAGAFVDAAAGDILECWEGVGLPRRLPLGVLGLLPLLLTISPFVLFAPPNARSAPRSA